MLRCSVGLREHRPCCRRQWLTVAALYITTAGALHA